MYGSHGNSYGEALTVGMDTGHQSSMARQEEDLDNGIFLL